ncbi:hypothetical protein Tco_0783611 [Tanacetum coccineum]
MNQKLKGSLAQVQAQQNMAFVSSSNNNTSNSNEAINAAHRVTTASTQVQSGVLQTATKGGHFARDCQNSKREVKLKKEFPPPYTRNFMPLTPDLSFTGLDEFVNKPVVENRKSDEEVFEIVRKNNDAPIIEEWVSDSEEENVSQPKTEKKTVKPSIAKIEFVKPKQQKKTARKIVKQAEKHRQNTHCPRGN